MTVVATDGAAPFAADTGPMRKTGREVGDSTRGRAPRVALRSRHIEAHATAWLRSLRRGAQVSS